MMKLFDYTTTGENLPPCTHFSHVVTPETLSLHFFIVVHFTFADIPIVEFIPFTGAIFLSASVQNTIKLNSTNITNETIEPHQPV